MRQVIQCHEGHEGRAEQKAYEQVSGRTQDDVAASTALISAMTHPPQLCRPMFALVHTLEHGGWRSKDTDSPTCRTRWSDQAEAGTLIAEIMTAISVDFLWAPSADQGLARGHCAADHGQPAQQQVWLAAVAR